MVYPMSVSVQRLAGGDVRVVKVEMEFFDVYVKMTLKYTVVKRVRRRWFHRNARC